MTVLLSPDIYIEYFSGLYKPRVGDIKNDINALINNSNNTQVISKAHIDQIEAMSNKEDFDQFYMPFITELLSGNVINIGADKPNSLSDTIDKIIEKNNSSEDPKKIDAVIVLKEENSGASNGNLVVQNVKRASFEWVLFKIACYNPQPITLRHYDFLNDKQIRDLFNAILKLDISKNYISIFDRQTNLQHHLFDSIKHQNIHYYTARPYKPSEQRDVARRIVRYIPRAKVFYADKDMIHERKIMFDNLLIEVDDDFWMLGTKRPTWKIDFTYCSSTTASVKGKTIHFSRYFV